MRWTWDVLRHRAVAQRALLLPVLAVAVVGATLLGTFLLLLTAGQHRALAVGLEREPAASRELDARYLLTDATQGPQVLTQADAALDDFLGSLPVDRTTWLTSQMYEVEGTSDARPPYAYLASYPVVADGTRLVEGTMPTARADAAGHLQVAVPQEAAKTYGWHVGSVVRAHDAEGSGAASFVVTGTFERTGPRAPWSHDVLTGAMNDPAYPVLGTMGMARTQAWGPFVVSPDAFTSGDATLTQADLVAQPRFGETTAADVAALRDRLGTAQATLSTATSARIASFVLTTGLPQTIDDATAALQVTQTVLVIVGLVLVVLAVTVLLLAARLLAERRAAEQTLMASRGATGGQILRLAALESLVVALLTTAIAPWLSWLLYRAVTGVGPFQRAGLHDDPGRPAVLWAACAAAALVLAGVLLGPVLRRRGSVVDAEQQLVRQDRRGGLARTGADLALVVLAILAVAQLRTYRSPVLAGVGGLDPVLVVAPALVLLAGGVVALRLLPGLARGWERAAARGRALAGPLAAWEIARRPGRAAGSVLLVTLVVGAGAFAQSFLATWHTSQLDQSDLAVGTDVRVVPGTGTPLAAVHAFEAEPAVGRASAVIDRPAGLGSPSNLNADVQGQLVALDTTHAGDLLRGRTGAAGWSQVAAPLHPVAVLQGVALPGAPSDLVLDVTTSTTPALTGTIVFSLVVQDADGGLTSIDLPSLNSESMDPDVVVPLPAAARGSSLVGVQAVLLPSDGDQSTLSLMRGELELHVKISRLRVVDGAATGEAAAGPRPAPTLADIDPAQVTRVSLADAPWSARGLAGPDSASSVANVHRDGDSLRVGNELDPTKAIWGGQGFAVVAAPATDPVRSVLATPGLLSSTDSKVGDRLTVDLDGVPVSVKIVGTVAHLPGEPRSEGILADSAALTRSYLLGGGTASLADEWWLQVPDGDADAVAAHLVDVGAATTRVAARADSTLGPLHVGIQAALWIVTAAAVGLAAAGLALSATVSVRTRRLELARLQAVGASRRTLVRSVLTEYAVLGGLGVVVGLALGALLGGTVVPLVTVSASGAPPVPSVLVQGAWTSQGRLLALLVLLVGAVVATTTSALLRRASGELLRLGDER